MAEPDGIGPAQGILGSHPQGFGRPEGMHGNDEDADHHGSASHDFSEPLKGSR